MNAKLITINVELANPVDTVDGKADWAATSRYESGVLTVQVNLRKLSRGLDQVPFIVAHELAHHLQSRMFVGSEDLSKALDYVLDAILMPPKIGAH